MLLIISLISVTCLDTNNITRKNKRDSGRRTDIAEVNGRIVILEVQREGERFEELILGTVTCTPLIRQEN